MRILHTFLLRLLLDSAEPERLCGALQRLPEGNVETFADAQELLELLRAAALTAPLPGARSSDPPKEETT